MRSLALLATTLTLIGSGLAYSPIMESSFVTKVASASGSLQDANCQCSCACTPLKEIECQLDLYIMLDAAVCVKDIWEEMKFRVNNLLRVIDDEHTIGHASSIRVSVSKYASNYKQVIAIDAESHTHRGKLLNFQEISHKIDTMSYDNDGSYLNVGLEGISNQLQQDIAKEGQRNRAILFITNGKSHNEVKNREINDDLMRIRNLVNGRLYFNTLVEIAEYKDCQACDFNRYLLNPKRFIESYEREAESIIPGLIVRSEKNSQLDSVDNQNRWQGAIISKLDLVKYFKAEVEFICKIKEQELGQIDTEAQDCTRCQCKCEVIPGPEGPQGIAGINGPKGCDGCNGKPGQPGPDGRCGLPGPHGAPGIPGRPGSPGRHGSPGNEGPVGPRGQAGVVGVNGATGNPGAPGNNGSRGPVGAPGAPGPDGHIGEPGPKGSPGAPGPDGNVGLGGPVGMKGEKGDAGSPGKRGPTGDNGPKGPRGARGEAGIDGKPGHNGPQGPKGFTGAQGPQGASGSDGKDGEAGDVGITGNPGPVGRDGRLGAAPSDADIQARIRMYLAQILPMDGDNKIKNYPSYECANFRSQLYMDVLMRLVGSAEMSQSSYSSGSSSGSYSSGSSSGSYSSGSNSGSYNSGSSYSSGFSGQVQVQSNSGSKYINQINSNSDSYSQQYDLEADNQDNYGYEINVDVDGGVSGYEAAVDMVNQIDSDINGYSEGSYSVSHSSVSDANSNSHSSSYSYSTDGSNDEDQHYEWSESSESNGFEPDMGQEYTEEDDYAYSTYH